MTNKKTPAKKSAPKKRANVSTLNGGWTTNLNPEIAPHVEPPAGETRVSELEAENYALKMLLKKQQPDPLVWEEKQPSLAILSIESLVGELDKQISRYYNGMNVIDSIADKIKHTPNGGQVMDPGPEPYDLIGKFDEFVKRLTHLNNRIENTGAFLQSVI